MYSGPTLFKRPRFVFFGRRPRFVARCNVAIALINWRQPHLLKATFFHTVGDQNGKGRDRPAPVCISKCWSTSIKLVQHQYTLALPN